MKLCAELCVNPDVKSVVKLCVNPDVLCACAAAVTAPPAARCRTPRALSGAYSSQPHKDTQEAEAGGESVAGGLALDDGPWDEAHLAELVRVRERGVGGKVTPLGRRLWRLAG